MAAVTRLEGHGLNIRILPPLIFTETDGEELVRRVAPLVTALLAG